MKSAKKILPLPSVPVSTERNLRAVGLYWFISRIVQVRGELFTADYKSSDKIIMSMFRYSAVKRSIGFTTGFHNHREGPY